MEKLKQELIQYKWVFIIGLAVAIVLGVIGANLHVFSFMTYKAKGDTPSIIGLLKKDIKNTKRQDDWYYKQGVSYLLQEGSQESLDFLDENFGDFIPERQYDIIEGYNKRQLLLKNQKAFMTLFMQDISHQGCKTYLQRMAPEALDEALYYYFGAEPTVDKTLVETLGRLLSSYPHQIPLNKFKFDLYEVLVLEDEALTEQKAILFSKCESEKARELFFAKLKTKPVALDTLKEWVEFLNRSGVLRPQEYVEFSNKYSEIQLARQGLKDLETKEVDLNNQKEAIELQLGDRLKLLEQQQQTRDKLQTEVKELENKLESLADYAYMALYIEAGSGLGKGEYEASTPKKNIFGNYKASSQKYIVKLSSTEFYKEGVYYVDVYLKGTKTNKVGNEYPYYVEVSNEELKNMETLQGQRQDKVKELETLTSQLGTLEKEVENMKTELGYEQNRKDLVELVQRRQELAKKCDEKVVEIKTLFGIGAINLPE